MKIQNKCHQCDSVNVKTYSDYHYGHRNGIYIGAYQEKFYACEVHKPKKKEKAELWDSLSDSLKGIYASQFKYGATTIQNTSNASSHIDVLKEEYKEMVSNKKDYDKDMERYESSLFCTYCGNNELSVTFIYNRTVANGEEWVCKSCNAETLVDEEPNADNY